MSVSLNILQQIRRLICRVVENLSLEQWLSMPAGFDNNIAWNVGHTIVVQQLLLYRLSGLEMLVAPEMVAMYRAGTSPANWAAAPDPSLFKEQLLAHPDRLEADLAAGKFQTFQPYKTSTGLDLPTFEHALVFNNYHEGLHLGAILALKNLAVG